MKATIERATLLRCLSHVQSVVERRNTIPILSNVLIEASGGGAVKVMATDLDLQVVETMSAASVDSPGAVTVSAHLLFDIARKLPEGAQVELSVADGRMAIVAGRARTLDAIQLAEVETIATESAADEAGAAAKAEGDAAAIAE